jgi:hypothetical protein
MHGLPTGIFAAAEVHSQRNGGSPRRRASLRFDDRRVKALVHTGEAERLRASFWRDLVEDPGPLAPLNKSNLQTLIPLLNESNHSEG